MKWGNGDIGPMNGKLYTTAILPPVKKIKVFHYKPDMVLGVPGG
jgi:hypothetical protein